MKHLNWMVAVALSAIGVIAAVATWHMEFWPPHLGPGAGFLPVSLGVILALLGLGIAVTDWRSRSSDVDESLNLAKPTRAATAFVAYLLVLDFLGFAISTALFLLIYLWWVEKRGTRTTIVSSVAITAATYIVFVELLNVDLPSGAFAWSL